MESIIKFFISTNKYFDLLVPKFKNKFNYYYSPSKSLDLFDKADLILRQNNKDILVLSDTIESILSSIKQLENIQELPNNIYPGKLGKYYNQKMKEEDFESIKFENFWIWSGTKIQVWVYRKNKQVYLEISETYPFLFSSEKYNDEEFNNFLEHYNPILFEELSSDIIDELLKRAYAVLIKADEHHKKAHF